MKTNKDKWATPELFLAKNVGKALLRQYDDVGFQFEDAIPVWLEMFPWLKPRYESVNGIQWPDMKKLRERMEQTHKRRMVMTTRAKQMGVKPLAEKLAALRRVVTFEEALEMGANVPEVETMQFLYVSRAFRGDVYVGGKIGITAVPYFRSSQNNYTILGRSGIKIEKHYSLLIELVPSEVMAKKVETRAKIRCVKKFGEPIDGEECFAGSLDEIKSEILAAVCEEGFPCKFVHEEWNRQFKKTKEKDSDKETVAVSK